MKSVVQYRMAKTNIAVLGAQWGDEGKGKIVDLLTPHFSIVARYQGGHNAGHTVYVERHEVRPAPDSVRHPAPGRHLRHRQRRGRRSAGAVRGNRRAGARWASTSTAGCSISDKAHVILPYHRELDLLSEARRGERKIGTTSRGIGPAYEDKIARRGIRVCDLLAIATALERGSARERQRAQPADQGLDAGLEAGVRPAAGARRAACGRGSRDVSLLLRPGDARRAGACCSKARRARCSTSITAPIRSSPRRTPRSAASAPASACRPRAIGGVLGVAKAYTTRVGEGPLPTELSGELGNRLRESGKEYGAVDRPAAPLRLVRRGRRALLRRGSTASTRSR